MTWLALWQLVSQQNERFLRQAPLVVQLPEDKTLWLSTYGKVEEVNNAAVDASIRRFARDRFWPSLSPTESYFLRERIRFVLPFAMLLAQPSDRGLEDPVIHNPPPSLADETQIEWLLIGSWEIGGRSDWLARVKRAIQPGHIGEI